MQAGRDRLQSMMELVARFNGSKDAAFNHPTFASKLSARADGTIFIALPSRSLLPPADYATGSFFFIADYSVIDGDDVVR